MGLVALKSPVTPCHTLRSPVARESWPLNKEYSQYPKGNMGVFGYSRPGGLEAWRPCVGVSARLLVSVGLVVCRVDLTRSTLREVGGLSLVHVLFSLCRDRALVVPSCF